MIRFAFWRNVVVRIFYRLCRFFAALNTKSSGRGLVAIVSASNTTNRRLAISVHDDDIRQMATFLNVVGTVAHDKHVADREADEIDCDPDLAPLRFVE
jgi:hypothetical protein